MSDKIEAEHAIAMMPVGVRTPSNTKSRTTVHCTACSWAAVVVMKETMIYVPSPDRFFEIKALILLRLS